MNKLNSIIFLILIQFGSYAHAVPMTYRFEGIGDFLNPSITQTLTVDVTVNNGSTSGLNQSYLNTDIVALAFDDGIARVDLNLVDNFSRIQGATQYISTDNFGIPTLDLTTQIVSSTLLSSEPIFSSTHSEFDTLALGTNMFGNGSLPIFAAINNTFYQRLTPLAISGTNITPTTSVPEPSTYILMGLGLLGIAYNRRKTLS